MRGFFAFLAFVSFIAFLVAVLGLVGVAVVAFQGGGWAEAKPSLMAFTFGTVTALLIRGVLPRDGGGN